MRQPSEKTMRKWLMDSAITCSCGNKYELDGECYCGRPNPLKKMRLI